MQQPKKIQLAIQGGGAKIVTLVAAMEAIQLLQDQGILKITRIAGTSAGAIVGTLFAAGIRMDTVKLYLQQDLGRELVKSFTKPKKRSMLARIPFGFPLWNIKKFEAWLKDRFSEKNVSKLKDLDIPVLVIATDLGNSVPRTFKDDDFVVSSILDSCGLPYYFRMWNPTGPVYVDGGICENLPIRDLQQAEADGDGPIVALSFEPVIPGPPRNLVDFSMSLIDTAMNNSIERAKSLINPNCIHTIKTKLTTFDFGVSLNQGLGDSYALVKERADKWFRDFVMQRQKGQKVVVGDPWRDPNATASEIMNNLSQVYALQHAGSKIKYKECTFEVIANSLLEEGDLYYGAPDIMKYSNTFQPLAEPIYCLRARLAEATDDDDTYLGRTQWFVTNANKQNVKSIGVPIRDPKNPKARYLLIFFDPVLQPNSGEYTLDFQDEATGVMKLLIPKNSKDEMVFSPARATGKIDRINIIFHLPIRRKDIKMEGRPGPFANRSMTDKELDLIKHPPQFYTLGWIGTDIDSKDIPKGFGVDLYS